MVRAHVFISGRVQGVFYRMYTRKEAEALDISGWVRNLSDGRVEAVFEGQKERVNEMIAWCWSGSPSSNVFDVEVNWEEIEGLNEFQVYSTV